MCTSGFCGCETTSKWGSTHTHTHTHTFLWILLVTFSVMWKYENNFLSLEGAWRPSSCDQTSPSFENKLPSFLPSPNPPMGWACPTQKSWTKHYNPTKQILWFCTTQHPNTQVQESTICPILSCPALPPFTSSNLLSHFISYLPCTYLLDSNILLWRGGFLFYSILIWVWSYCLIYWSYPLFSSISVMNQMSSTFIHDQSCDIHARASLMIQTSSTFIPP